MLASFLARPAVQQRYAEPRSAFLAALEEHQRADELLTKFKAACASSAPSIRLPTSLALNIVKRCKLSPPAADPHFFATETAALALIEKEASEKIYNVLLEAKSKQVKHLHAAAKPPVFAAHALAAHTAYVRSIAADTNALYVSASQPASAADSASVFPIADAIAHFELHLQSVVADVVSLTVDQRRAAQAAKAAALAAESQAQETVLAGAHTGETIRSIAEKVVHRELKAAAKPAAAASSSHSHSNKAASSQHRPAPRNNDNRTASHAASSSSHASTKPNATSHANTSGLPNSKHRPRPRDELLVTTDTEGDRRVQGSRSHAGHSANNMVSSSSHPKNARGGDRSPRPRRPQAAASKGKRKQGDEEQSMSDTASAQHQQRPHKRR